MKLYPQPKIALSSDLRQCLDSYKKHILQEKILYTSNAILQIKDNGKISRLLIHDQPLEKRETASGQMYLLDKSTFLEHTTTTLQIEPQHYYELQTNTIYCLSPACELIIQENNGQPSHVYFSGTDEKEMLKSATTFLSLLK